MWVIYDKAYDYFQGMIWEKYGIKLDYYINQKASR